MNKIEKLIQIYSDALNKDLPFDDYYKFLEKNNLNFGICHLCHRLGWENLKFISKYVPITQFWVTIPFQIKNQISYYFINEEDALEYIKYTLKYRLSKLKKIKEYYEKDR